MMYAADMTRILGAKTGPRGANAQPWAMDVLDLGLDATSWFIARQPAIVRFLEERFGADSDTFALAVHHSVVLEALLRQEHRTIPRVLPGRMENAELLVLTNTADEGVNERHPWLVEYCTEVANQPVAIAPEELARVALTMFAVL